MEPLDIVKRIKSLPPLPESVIELEELFAGGDPDLRVLTKIIEKDSALTANILAHANSPYYGMQKNIVSVSQAVMLFGAVQIRGFTLASLIDKSFKFDMSVYGIDNSVFGEVSSLQSALMFQWYMGVDIEKSKHLIPIAFLMETGRIIIANELSQSEHAQQFLELVEQKGLTYTERLFTGFTAAEVAAALFEHWHFHEIFTNTMQYLDNIENAPEAFLPYIKALDVVRTCINIREIMTESSFEAATEKVIQYGLSSNLFVRTVERLQKKRQELA